MEEADLLRSLPTLDRRLSSLSALLTDFILENEVRDADQGGVWLHHQTRDPGRSSYETAAYGSAGPDLYDGTAGISIGLLSSFLTCPSDRLGETITRASKRSIQALSSSRNSKPGMYTGLGGGIWGLSALDLVGQPREVAELKDDLLNAWLPNLTPEVISAEGSKFDLIDGCAGAILCLRKLRKEHGADQTLELEESLLEAIISGAERTSRGPCWPEMEDDPGLCSVSHGNSGVVAVLAGTDPELRDRLGLTELLDEAIGYETSWLSASGTGWPDLRERLPETADISPPPEQINLWCHGAPGIGLVRSFILGQGLGSEAMKSEIVIARRATLGSMREMIESALVPLGLCHGVMGLAVTAKELGVPASDFLSPIVDTLEIALTEANLGNRVDGLLGTETFGLMTGLSGVLFGINILIDDFIAPPPNPLTPWRLGDFSSVADL